MQSTGSLLFWGLPAAQKVHTNCEALNEDVEVRGQGMPGLGSCLVLCLERRTVCLDRLVHATGGAREEDLRLEGSEGRAICTICGPTFLTHARRFSFSQEP